MACVGPYSFFEQGHTNPNRPAHTILKKIFEQNERGLGNSLAFFSSVLAHF